MKFPLLKSFIFLLGFWLLAPMAFGQTSDYASRYPDLADKDPDFLMIELENINFLQNLRNSKFSIDGPRICGKHVRKTKESRQELIDLNGQFKDNPTAEYQVKARALKRENEQARTEYRNCFSSKLGRWPLLAEKGVYSYETHRARSLSMSEIYSDITDLDDYIEALNEALEGDSFVARVLSVSGDVQSQSWGIGPWSSVSTGHQLEIGDHIATGAKGRVQIIFEEKVGSSTGRSVTVFIGGNTETEIYAGMESIPSQSMFSAAIGLVRGIVRAVTNNWGRKDEGVFSVRAGTTIVGIRGTEVAVSYDPKRNFVEAHLDHGDAFVEAGGKRITLQPQTSVSVVDDQIGTPRPMMQSIWTGMVSITEPRELGQPGKPSQSNTNGGSRIRTEAEVSETYARITRRSAEEAANSFVTSFTLVNKQLLLMNTRGKLYDYYVGALKTESLKTLLDRNRGHTISHKLRCTFCNENGSECQILMDIQMAGEPMGRTTPTYLFVTRDEENRHPKVSDAGYAKPENIAKFMALGPICKF